jgi:GTP-binding nuclear protein Ran
MQNKVILLGDGGIGKSTFLKKSIYGDYEKRYISTVGIDVKYDEFSNINFWDTPGQEKYNNNIQIYNNAKLFLVMFDLTAKKTLDSLDFWTQQIINNFHNPNIIYLGNKNDEPQNLQIEKAKILNKIKKITKKYNIINNNIKYYEISVKNNNNIVYIYNEIQSYCYD